MPLADRFRLVWTPFLKKHKGRLRQAVGLVCPAVLGCGGEFTLRAGKRKYTARKIDLLRYPNEIESQSYPPTYLWLIPRPARPTRVSAVWKTPLGQVHRDSFTLKPAEPCDVHVVFKTHIDLGYTDRLDAVLRLYRAGLMERLLKDLEATAGRKPGKRFVWMMSTWLLEQCLDPKHVAPGHVKRLEHYIRNGQVVWGLMPFTTHTEFFGLEEMCRSLYAARRLAERFGRPVPTAAKMTDVPAHAAALAMAFAAAGGKFFQIGTNPDSRPPAVPPLFWWKLPDGSRLLCHYHGTYGTALLPPPEWPWRHWLSVQMTGDNVGPQGLDLIAHIDWIDAHFDWPICRTGRLETFADAVIRRHSKALPVVEAEFTDWWIHGIASQAQPTALARRTKDRLPSAEILATLASWASGRDLPDDLRRIVRQAYEKLALYTEHTWGDHATDARKALPTGNRYTSGVFAGKTARPPVDRWVASWNDKARHSLDAHEATDRIESRAVSSLAGVMKGHARKLGIALFNTLSRARGGLVRFSGKGLPAGSFELVDPTTGAAVSYQRDKSGIEFIAPAVPPCGYLVLEVKPVARRSRRPGHHAEWDQRNLALHTAEHTLQFHAAGGMARWHDRARSCQWFSTEAEFPMGTYLYEMPGGDRVRAFARQVHTNCWPGTPGFFHRNDYEKMSDFGPVGGGRATVRPEITPLYARVIVEANCPARKVPDRRSGDARSYRTTFTQYRGQRELHVNVSLIGKRATYAAEAGYAFFPLIGDHPFVLIDRIAQLVEPGEDLARGVNAAHMAVHRGVRIEGAYAGMNFYPLDTPLVSFGQPGAYRFDDDGDYETGVLYATLFNNCWGTNFAQWQSGDFSFDFILQPTGNDDWDGGLARGGAEFFRPLVAAVVGGPRGEPARSLLRIDPACVQLVALKPAEFDPGTVIRLWNADVEPVKARMALPAGRQGDKLWRCDLLERPTKHRIPVSGGGEAIVSLKPNEIATLLLQPAGKR